MKKIVVIISFSLFAGHSFAQEAKQQIERACLDYIEGFYEGDTAKIIKSLKPSLYKFGYWKNKKSGKYEPDETMTFQQAVDYAKNVSAKKHFAKEGSPKKVDLLDIGNNIAAAKVTAWWGIDYVLLSKQDGKWMIEQVLWEGPLENK
ncbi:MAG: nuclear transport factor 2 family protein [Ferruginibacter sp.]